MNSSVSITFLFATTVNYGEPACNDLEQKLPLHYAIEKKFTWKWWHILYLQIKKRQSILVQIELKTVQGEFGIFDVEVEAFEFLGKQSALDKVIKPLQVKVCFSILIISSRCECHDM